MSRLHTHDNSNAPLIARKYCDCPGRAKCQCGEATSKLTFINTIINQQIIIIN